jgi:hypothetical protein
MCVPMRVPMSVPMRVPCVFSRVAENLASAHGTPLSQAALELLDALGGQGGAARKYCWDAAEIA